MPPVTEELQLISEKRFFQISFPGKDEEDKKNNMKEN